MYFQLGNEKILLNFDKGVYVRVTGPEMLYYVECLEYRGIDSTPAIVESYQVNSTVNWPQEEFHLPIEFYFDFEIRIFKFDDNFGLTRIFEHRYNDYGKLVRFELNGNDLDEEKIWLKRIFEYKVKHSCNIQIKSRYKEIEYFSDTKFQTRDLTPYRTYRVSRFFKESNDWKTIDPRKENMIWYGNWKTFWSYQHPRLWKNLNSQEIIDDILGL